VIADLYHPEYEPEAAYRDRAGRDRAEDDEKEGEARKKGTADERV